MPESIQMQVQLENPDDMYMLYSEEQIAEFIENGTIHEIIRDHLRNRYIEALCDLIIYTDTNDPDVLVDALSSRPDELDNEDRIWFLTNPTIIKTMFPETYTNILNLWAARLSNINCPIELIDTLYQIINPENPQYDEDVAKIWLSYGNLVEVIDLLSEFDAREVITDDADTLLFKYLATMLSEKIRLTGKTNDDGTTAVDILYVDAVQTYLDMLGNYIMPQIKRCAPEIVLAYEAMSEYLTIAGKTHYYGIPRNVHILFANSFHPDDIHIFKGICHAICKLPDFIDLSPGYYSSFSIFQTCCSFDLSEELETLLVKFGLTPETISQDEYSLKMVAKLLLAATSPVPKPQILDVITRLGLRRAYQEWFRAASYSELPLIDSCQFPLVAFDNESAQPTQSILNLQDYQSQALLIQFLRLHDLTNTNSILKVETDRLIDVFKSHQLKIHITPQDTSQILELISYLQGKNYNCNPNLAKNKLYQLMQLRNNGYISNYANDILEPQVIVRFITTYSCNNQKLFSDLEELLAEYQPKYIDRYLEVICNYPNQTNADCQTMFELFTAKYPVILTSEKPVPQEIIEQILDTIIVCSPPTLISRVSQLLKALYPEDNDMFLHNDILEQLGQVKFASKVKLDMLGIIQIYSDITRYQFQINTILVKKLLSEIPAQSSFGVQTLIDNSIFYKYYLVLSRHTNLDTARNIWCQILNSIYLNDSNTPISGIIKNAIPAKYLTHELCSYMCQVLTGTPFHVEINTDTNQGVSIRTTDENLKKQAISRWRKWSADRQIPYTEAGLLDIFNEEDPTECHICPISYEPIHLGSVVIKLTQCQHVFLAPHIDKWCQTNPSCPMCRNPLPYRKLNGAASEMFELV